MHIEAVEVRGVRSIKELVVELSPQLNVVFGDNGQGKTSLLEGIYMALRGGSFRTSRSTEAIGRGGTGAVVRLNVRGNDGILRRVAWSGEVVADRLVKKTLLDDRVVVVSELAALVPVVLFSPDEVDSIRSVALRRRKMLDLLLATVNAEYRSDLVEYFRIWRQRNQLLLAIKQGRASEEELDVWDARMAAAASRMVAARRGFLGEFADRVGEYLAIFMEGGEGLKLVYRPNLDAQNEDEYLRGLREARRLDVIRTFSTRGVHRDDIEFWRGDKNLGIEASRGEFRMLVLAWKLAEARLLADSGEAPVIMLDDVLSELDAHKRQKLLTILSGFQVVITTVDRLEMEVAGMGQIEMADGRVREVVRAS